MTPIDPLDPFPRVALDVAESPAALDHARAVDAWLGLAIESTEAAVRAERDGAELARFQTWSHISPQVFLTPYLELRHWLARLAPPPGSTVVDLGAGYGRLAFVLAHHHPGVQFIGIECVAARVHEANRVLRARGLAHAEMRVGDLTARDLDWPRAGLYFLYDCGSPEAVGTVIERLTRETAPGTQLLTRGLRACEAARGAKGWELAPETDYREAPGLHAERHVRTAD